MAIPLQELEKLIKDTLADSTPEIRYEVRKQAVKIEDVLTHYEVCSAYIEQRKVVVMGEEVKVRVLVLEITHSFDHMDYDGPFKESNE